MATTRTAPAREEDEIEVERENPFKLTSGKFQLLSEIYKELAAAEEGIFILQDDKELLEDSDRPMLELLRMFSLNPIVRQKATSCITHLDGVKLRAARAKRKEDKPTN